MYQVSLVENASGNLVGQLTVDSSTIGPGVVQFTSAATASTYDFCFCAFPLGTTGCQAVISVNTDNSGVGLAEFTFPGHGFFAGIFLGSRNGTDELTGGFNMPAAQTEFLAALQPAGQITGRLAGFQLGTDPLSSGQVTVNGTTAHVVVKGATVNTTYNVRFCMNDAGPDCFALGTLTTNSSGDGTADLDMLAAVQQAIALSGLFLVERSSGVLEFITGFQGQI